MPDNAAFCPSGQKLKGEERERFALSGVLGLRALAKFHFNRILLILSQFSKQSIFRLILLCEHHADPVCSHRTSMQRT